VRVGALLVASLLWAGPAAAQALSLLDVPFLSQSESLCGGAAAAMVLRYWGAQGLTAESFAGLVDGSAAGIRTDALRADLVARGWDAREMRGDDDAIARELGAGRPVIALIEDRPGTYHYVVVVGWHPRGVVVHDPARVPYRVMAPVEFRRRWQATRGWMLSVTPRAEPADRVSPTPPVVGTIEPSGNGQSCEALVARGVSEAQAGTLDVSERTLMSALGCPGNAPIRELAGLRALQRRWPEVAELSARVVAESPTDVYAWQLLATARFVAGDARGALAAWNAAGQPTLDLVEVQGLRRTRQRVVEGLAGLRTGDPLTLDALARVTRTLGDWPALTMTAVTYDPKPGGLADLRVAVTERDRVPSRPLVLGMIAARALITREVRVPFGPMTTGGDRVEFGWRFWPDRPRLSAALLAPAPWGGLWGAQISSERQPLTEPVLETFRHDSGGVVLSDWRTGRVRWQTGGGLDRWADRGRFATLHAGLDVATYGDGVRLRARGQSWFGPDDFGSLDVSVRATRDLRSGRYAVEGRAAASYVSDEAPYDIWPAGDTGHARTTLLRAHPLLDDGRYRTARLGATVVAGSVEAQRVWRPRQVQIAPALFADLGRTARRLVGGAQRDADVGIGLRLRFPGMPGTVRIDAGQGLRDGAHALSFVYEP